jgi:cytochrome P450
MINTLLPQSQLADPYSLYAESILHHPVYWDEANKIWAVYSYEYCLKILNDENAKVPPVNHVGVNPTIDLISRNLVRLSNPPKHETLKAVALYLFDKLNNVSVAEILFAAIEEIKDVHSVDWAVASRKIFPTLIVKGFDFPKEDEDFLIENMPSFLKIMSATNEARFSIIGQLMIKTYGIVEGHFGTNLFAEQALQHVASVYDVNEKDLLKMLVSNFIGLLIQSYDAGRGLLANGLLQLLQYKSEGGGIIAEENFFRKIVTETLRFDPPVHNTRRVAATDILIGESIIRNGETILLVLAAANRDATRFSHPDVFDINRSSNEHLTFGAGGHMCLAKYLCSDVAAKVFQLLIAKFPSLRLLQNKVQYEPLVNVRIPRSLLVELY